MKKTSLIFNAVLASALIGIYILHFNSQNKLYSEIKDINDLTKTLEEKPKIEVTENIEVVEVVEADSIIELKLEQKNESTTAFINIDTISVQWSYFKREGKKIEASVTGRQKALEQQYQELQNQYIQYQNLIQNGGLQDQAKEENMVREQQRIEKAMQETRYKTQNDMFTVNNKGMKRLNVILEQYAKSKGIKHIFAVGQSAGPSVLYSEKSLDITKPILKILNKKYK